MELTWSPKQELRTHRSGPSPQVDNRHQEEPLVTAEQAVQLCDRNFGIGGDGVCAPACCGQWAVSKCAFTCYPAVAELITGRWVMPSEVVRRKHAVLYLHR